jgi:hypothetical protein
MASRLITVQELDDLLVVLQDSESWDVGPQDRKLASYCVQLVRATLVVPSETPVFDLDVVEEQIQQEAAL